MIQEREKFGLKSDRGAQRAPLKFGGGIHGEGGVGFSQLGGRQERAAGQRAAGGCPPAAAVTRTDNDPLMPRSEAAFDRMKKSVSNMQCCRFRMVRKVKVTVQNVEACRFLPSRKPGFVDSKAFNLVHIRSSSQVQWRL